MLLLKKYLANKSTLQGFTLIEVLLVIAILAILAAVVIVAINPAKQFGEAQNAQRRSDVRAILDAVHQYSIDNYGSMPTPSVITTGTDCAADGDDICQSEISCAGINIDDLLIDQKYLVDIPSDPTTATDEITGYKIFKNASGRVGICAPDASDGAVISVIR